MTERSCGTCHACCVHDKVDALQKPPGVPCVHLNVLQDCGSCGIYEQRPSECQVYQCSWLEGRLPDEALRPDNSDLLYETGTIEWPKPLAIVMGFEHRAGALQQYRESLVAAAVDGVVIATMSTEGNFEIIGSAEDAAAFDLWLTACKRQGGVNAMFNDGAVRMDI